MEETLKIDSELYNALIQSFGKDVIEEKMDEILYSGLESKLEKFSRNILAFEERYGISFSEFEKRWDQDKISNKHSYKIESDFIDWEILEMEKKELLSALSKLKNLHQLLPEVIKMRAISYTVAHDDLAKTMKKVCEDHDPVIITRRNNEAVVMISLEDYEALNETSYLLQNPRNAKRLLESIEELESGKGIERNLLQ